jgi:type VI secretion system FHA domain protein
MIKAVAYNGQPTATIIVGEFGEQGGVIGRADGNALVLPDPERYVSRMHAMVVFRNGGYAIRDLSNASPVYLNGRPLGNGNEANVADGDELRIGPYTLQVVGEKTNHHAPVADPLDLFGQQSAAAPSAAKGGIPEDFDIFADPFSPQPAATPRPPAQSVTDDFGLGLAPAGGNDINKLFDLGPSSTNKFFPDGHPLADDGASLQGSQSVDPLVALGAVPAPKPVQQSQRNDTPEIRGAFMPPVMKHALVPEASDAVGARNMVVSWNEAGESESRDGIKTMIVESPLKAARKAPEPVRTAPAVPVRSTEHAAPQKPTAGAAGAQIGDIKLLQAFLDGAGVPDIDMKGPLTPETMHMLGQVLREATQGTLDLLVSRALIKREIHAEMTVIVTKENNPLKFSPNVEAALTHMLAPRGQGFMPPLTAMKDAYDDLRAHQFAFMAGMRAALAGTLRRFDPDPLEKRLTEKSLLDSVLPLNRKAKLWDLYREMYEGEIKREAEDDFHAWFGRAFLAAYEAQLDKLAQSDKDAAR